MQFYCWAAVYDPGPSLKQCWIIGSCLLRAAQRALKAKSVRLSSDSAGPALDCKSRDPCAHIYFPFPICRLTSSPEDLLRLPRSRLSIQDKKKLSWWLAGGWLVARWLNGRLGGWITSWLTGWLAGWLDDQLTGWLTLLAGWMADCWL